MNALEYFNAMVDSAVRNKQQSLQDFDDNLLAGGLLYAIEWSTRQAEGVALADMWLDVRRGAESEMEETGDKDEAVRVYSVLTDAVASATRSLLRNYFRASNTDMFTNAINGARAEAASRFVQDAERVIKMFDKE